MKKRSFAPLDTDVQNALLGDLESIRALLELPRSAVDIDDADDVPMLDDMVEGAFTVNEGSLTSRASIGDDSGASGLADDAIKALLDDEWRVSARRIISDARARIEDAAREQWTPEQADALNETLKVGIDATLDEWLTDVMYARIEDLRSRLLLLLEDEMKRFTEALTNDDEHG